MSDAVWPFTPREPDDPPTHHHVNPDADPASFDYGYTHAHQHDGPHDHGNAHTAYKPGNNADGSTPFVLKPHEEAPPMPNSPTRDIEDFLGRLPVPDWSRPGEIWRIEPEDRDWSLADIDGEDEQCRGDRGRCPIPATAVRHGRFSEVAFCVRHLREGGMWVENDRVVSWRLSPPVSEAPMPTSPDPRDFAQRFDAIRRMPAQFAYEQLIEDLLEAVLAATPPAPGLDACPYDCDACHDFAALTEAEREAELEAGGSPDAE